MRYLTNFLIACLSSFNVFASEIALESRIESVSLFRDGAMVTRVGTLSAPAGRSVISLSSLPTAIDQSVLQASFANESEGVIRNARLWIPSDPQEPELVESLRASEREKQRQIRLIEQKIKNAQSRAAFAEQIGDSFAKRYGQTEEGSALTLDQARSTWDYIHETKIETQSAVIELEESLHVLRKELMEVSRELGEAVEQSSQLRSFAEIEIEMDVPQQVDLVVSYLVNRASWQPRYELRAKPDQGVLSFGYFAEISQRTGEDWNDIDLSLHTNAARRGGNAPTLHPLRVERAQDYSSKSLRAPALSPFETDAAPDSSAKAPLRQQTQFSASTVSFQADIAGKLSVPSSEDQTTLPVAGADFDAEFWSEAVPRVQLDAYLRGRAVNKLSLPILPGEALAFVDGKLSSRVTLGKTLPEEELELSFGPDPMIVVKRIEGAQRDADSGFIDKTVTLRREYTNQATNHRTVAHKVVIVDQFPISQNAKIEIRRIAPKESSVIVDEEDKDKGIFRWEATLGPKETRSFVIEYEIVHPRDWSIEPEL